MDVLEHISGGSKNLLGHFFVHALKLATETVFQKKNLQISVMLIHMSPQSSEIISLPQCCLRYPLSSVLEANFCCFSKSQVNLRKKIDAISKTISPMWSAFRWCFRAVVDIKTNTNTDNSLQAGVDCKGTNCLVSFRCHHTPSPYQSDWQVSIWSFGAKLLPFPVTIWCFFLGEQMELSAAVHVLGSLPVQLPDQTPWHPLQVPAQYAFPLFFFYSDLLDFSLFYRHSLSVNCAQKSFNKRLPQLGDLIQWPFCEHYIRSHHCQIVIIVIIVTIVGLSDFHHCWVVIVSLSSYCQS